MLQLNTMKTLKDLDLNFDSNIFESPKKEIRRKSKNDVLTVSTPYRIDSSGGKIETRINNPILILPPVKQKK